MPLLFFYFVRRFYEFQIYLSLMNPAGVPFADTKEPSPEAFGTNTFGQGIK